MMNTDRGESDFQIVPSKHNGDDGTWILVDSHGDVEIRDTRGNIFAVTYEEMKQRVGELLQIDSPDLNSDLKIILAFADRRREAKDLQA